RAHAARRPLVLINRDIDGLPRVLMDVGRGITQAIAHLAEQGHRRIAYVSGPPASWANQERQIAAVKAAERLGLSLVAIPAPRPTYQGGEHAAAELATTDVTGIVAFDDLVAQGVMAGLAARNLQVPAHMSIV